MHLRARFGTVLLSLVCALPAAASGVVLYDQPSIYQPPSQPGIGAFPFPSWGGAAWGGPSVNGLIRTFDNFTINAGGTVASVAWYGFYAGPDQPPLPNTINWDIGFYASSQGQLGANLFDVTLPAAAVTATILGEFAGPPLCISANPNVGCIPAVNVYRFEATLPTGFVAALGTEYWFSPYSIQATNPDLPQPWPPTSPSFFLIHGTGGDHSVYTRSLSADGGVNVEGLITAHPGLGPTDVAFTLFATPEPGSMLLLGVPLLIGALRIRKTRPRP
ncbi:MAG: PEP-CTERM sorting domain-containing protein [Acidobacteriia bacterium]|nr:PEP-CTERM sorting domain-containing protein [Terriglobia bacterium]